MGKGWVRVKGKSKGKGKGYRGREKMAMTPPMGSILQQAKYLQYYRGRKVLVTYDVVL
jgi:hypothetical protein